MNLSYYDGHNPIVCSSDLDMIDEIFSKQYMKFSARKHFSVEPPDSWDGAHLLSAAGMTWKRMRNIMNPTFSSLKLRELNPLLVKCVDRLVDKIKRSSSGDINSVEMFKRFTLDSIWQCAFGVDADAQNKKDDPYYEKCEQAIKNFADLSIFSYLFFLFHEFGHQVFYAFLIYTLATRLVSKSNMDAFFWLRDETLKIYNLRKSMTQSNKKDYIQILLETQIDANVSFDDKDANLTNSKLKTEKKMTVQEIASNLALFMIAGYETTSSTLSNAFFILASHPEEQEKLRNELIENLKNVFILKDHVF